MLTPTPALNPVLTPAFGATPALGATPAYGHANPGHEPAGVPANSPAPAPAAASRARFVACERAERCPFDGPLDLTPADAEEGGLAKLCLAHAPVSGPGHTSAPTNVTIAVKRFHAARELDAALFAQHRRAAEEEFRRMELLDGAQGHAPRAFALGSAFDELGFEHPAIAMAYVEGFTLEDALRAGLLSGSLRQRDKTQVILEVGLHIARAVRACGAYTHRDLSPRNIMLSMDEHGEVSRAVIIDFGQSVETASPLVTPSARPHRLATISFGAPEIFGGPFYARRNEPGVDVYALGAILHYLRTRSIPFLDLSALDASRADHASLIVEAKRTPLDTAGALGPSLRPVEQRLAELVAACTAFDPGERPRIGDIILWLEALTQPATEARNANSPASTERADDSAKYPRRKAASEGKPVPPYAAQAHASPAASASPHAQPAECGEPARRGAAPNERQSPEALYAQAQNYFYGHGGLPRSPRLARESLVDAARAGSVSAQFRLGRSLALESRDAESAAEARFWLESAAALGHPGARATMRALAL